MNITRNKNADADVIDAVVATCYPALNISKDIVFDAMSACRRNAPIPYLGRTNNYALWPNVESDDWCGEYEWCGDGILREEKDE